MIRKRFYMPLICIGVLFALKFMMQTSRENEHPYVDRLNGITGQYYESGSLVNGDSLLLIKVTNVEYEDFQGFTKQHGMMAINNVNDLMLFNFHQEQAWWPYPKDFKIGNKFYRRYERSEFFACLIDDVCYISFFTW